MIPLMNDHIYVSFSLDNKCQECDSITTVCCLPLCGSQYSQGVSAIGIVRVLVVMSGLYAPLLLKHNLKVDHFYKVRFNSISTEELRCNPHSFSHVIILPSGNRKQQLGAYTLDDIKTKLYLFLTLLLCVAHALLYLSEFFDL